MKTLLAVPTLGLYPDPDQWLASFLSVFQQCMLLGMEVTTTFPYRMPWEIANNAVFDLSRDQGFDYILRMDDDMWNVPPNAVQLLLEAQKPVVGAAYPMRTYPYGLCALIKVLPDLTPVDIWKQQERGFRAASGTGLQQVDLIGFGLTLIRVKDIMGLPRNPFTGMGHVPDDTWFCQLCHEHGIERWVHLGLQICHRHVTPWNCDLLKVGDERVRPPAPKGLSDAVPVQ